VFDLAAHPGQWIYLGSYIAVLVISVPTVVFHRRARRPLPPAAPAFIPVPRPGRQGRRRQRDVSA